MDDRQVEKKLKQGKDVDLGKHDRPIHVAGDVRSDLKGEIAELQKEKELPQSLDYNQAIEILIGRSRSFRNRRDNPEIRETMKK